MTHYYPEEKPSKKKRYASAREYRLAHKPEQVAYMRRWREENYKKAHLNVAKQRAKKRNIYFELVAEEIPDMPMFCPVLGIELEINEGHAKDNSPSLDRIDSTKGYTAENITWISHRANTLKSNGSVEEHRRIADWMEQHGL